MNAEQFIQIWQTAMSKEEVKATMAGYGLKESAINARASRYRKAGIKLKDFRGGGPPGRNKLDIPYLITCAESYDQST